MSQELVVTVASAPVLSRMAKVVSGHVEVKDVAHVATGMTSKAAEPPTRWGVV